MGETSRSIALALWGERIVLHLILNAYWEGLDFEIPPLEAGMAGWRRIVDTSLESPDDIWSAAEAPLVGASTYRAGPRSVVVLASARTPAGAAEGAPR
jgi:glycogen operon protein